MFPRNSCAATAATACNKGQVPTSNDLLLLCEVVTTSSSEDASGSKEIATQVSDASGRIFTPVPRDLDYI